MLKGSTFPDRAPLYSNLVNGQVYGVCDTGEHLYLSGQFNRTGHNVVPGFCKLDVASGKFKPLSKIGVGFNGPVNDICIVGDYAYVVGEFTLYNNTAAQYIAKIKISDGSLDTSFTGYTNSPINTIIKDPTNDYLYIGGEFNSWQTHSAGYFVKVNLSGQMDPRFDSTFGKINDSVNVIIYDDDSLYLGGKFTRYDAIERGRVVKIDAHDAGIDGNFRPMPGFDNIVYAMALDPISRHLYCGGEFTTYDWGAGVWTPKWLAKINCDSGEITPDIYEFQGNLNVDSPIITITLDQAKTSIYVSGGVDRQEPITTVKKLDSCAGFLVPGFVSPIYHSSKIIQEPISGDLILNWRDHAFYGCAEDQKRIQRISSITGETIFSYDIIGNTSDINTIAIDPSTNEMLIGTQAVTSWGGIERIGLIKIRKSDWSVDSTFDPGTAFSSFNGYARSRGWAHTIIKDPNSDVLYLAGNFYAYQGVSHQFVVKINSLTAQLITTDSTDFSYPTWFPDVFCMIQIGNYLYIGGNFTQINWVNRRGIGKISCTNFALDTTFNTTSGVNTGQAVTSILYDISDPGNIIIGGSFTTFKGTARQRIAKISNSTAALNGTFTSNTGANNQITCLKQLTPGGSIFAGGYFSAYKSIARAQLVKLNPTTSAIDMTFNTLFGFNGGYIYQISQDASGNLIVIGSESYAQHYTGGITKIDPVTAARITEFLSGETSNFNNDRAKGCVVDNNNLYIIGNITQYFQTQDHTGPSKIVSGIALLDANTALLKTK